MSFILLHVDDILKSYKPDPCEFMRDLNDKKYLFL